MNCMVELPITGREYYQMIESLWIPQLLDNVTLSRVNKERVACAELSNPRHIINHICIILSGHLGRQIVERSAPQIEFPL